MQSLTALSSLDESRAARSLFRKNPGESAILVQNAVSPRFFNNFAFPYPWFDVQPLELGVSLNENESISFPDVFAIDAQRFAALNGDALARLHAGGFLGCAIWALSSLENMNQLIRLKNAKRAAEG